MTELQTRLDPDAAMTTVISAAEDRLVIQVRAQIADSGDLEIQGRIDDHDFALSGRPGWSAYEQPTRTLDTAEREMLRPWRGLTRSLAALAQATREPATATDETHWNCDACLLMGATVSHAAYACVAGDAGACGVLIDA